MSDAASLTPAVAVLCEAAEEWANARESLADSMAAMGQEGRRAAVVVRAEVAEIREAVATFRPLRRYDTDAGEWVES